MSTKNPADLIDIHAPSYYNIFTQLIKMMLTNSLLG